jgi:hypothetical protein
MIHDTKAQKLGVSFTDLNAVVYEGVLTADR